MSWMLQVGDPRVLLPQEFRKTGAPRTSLDVITWFSMRAIWASWQTAWASARRSTIRKRARGWCWSVDPQDISCKPVRPDAKHALWLSNAWACNKQSNRLKSSSELAARRHAELLGDTGRYTEQHAMQQSLNYPRLEHGTVEHNSTRRLTENENALLWYSESLSWCWAASLPPTVSPHPWLG